MKQAHEAVSWGVYKMTLHGKTDQVNASELAEKTHNYQRQLRLYGRALRHIYGRPVTRSWLHFLTPGQSVSLQLEKD